MRSRLQRRWRRIEEHNQAFSAVTGELPKGATRFLLDGLSIRHDSIGKTMEPRMSMAECLKDDVVPAQAVALARADPTPPPPADAYVLTEAILQR